MISSAPGTAPEATISETVRPAASIVSKYATSVRTVSGTGTTRSVMRVAIPSVPSDPTKAPTRSSPGRSSSAPPSVTTSPSGSTTSSPVT
jgi:hypothetical protein